MMTTVHTIPSQHIHNLCSSSLLTPLHLISFFFSFFLSLLFVFFFFTPTGGGDYYINNEGVTDQEMRGKTQQTRGETRSPDRPIDVVSDYTTLYIRPPSVCALDAMRDVTKRFYNKECEVSGLIDSALGADPSNFKKVL